MASIAGGSLSLKSLLPEKVLNGRSGKIEYKAWYEKIMNYLACCDLADALLSSDEVKVGSKSSKKIDVVGLQQKCVLVYSIIMSRLDDQLIIQFSTIEKGNAFKLLEAIKSRFSAVNFFSKLQARREFNRIFLRNDESISSYGARIRYAAKELELMDKEVNVSEMELISRLVEGLPKEYDNLILGLIRGIETIKFEEFVTILESKVSMSKKKEGVIGGGFVPNFEGSEFANAISNPLRGKFKTRGNCYTCGEYGHKSSYHNNNEGQLDATGNGSPGEFVF